MFRGWLVPLLLACWVENTIEGGVYRKEDTTLVVVPMQETYSEQGQVFHEIGHTHTIFWDNLMIFDHSPFKIYSGDPAANLYSELTNTGTPNIFVFKGFKLPTSGPDTTGNTDSGALNSAIWRVVEICDPASWTKPIGLVNPGVCTTAWNQNTKEDQHFANKGQGGGMTQTTLIDNILNQLPNDLWQPGIYWTGDDVSSHAVGLVGNKHSLTFVPGMSRGEISETTIEKTVFGHRLTGGWLVQRLLNTFHQEVNGLRIGIEMDWYNIVDHQTEMIIQYTHHWAEETSGGGNDWYWVDIPEFHFITPDNADFCATSSCGAGSTGPYSIDQFGPASRDLKPRKFVEVELRGLTWTPGTHFFIRYQFNMKCNPASSCPDPFMTTANTEVPIWSDIIRLNEIQMTPFVYDIDSYSYLLRVHTIDQAPTVHALTITNADSLTFEVAVKLEEFSLLATYRPEIKGDMTVFTAVDSGLSATTYFYLDHTKETQTCLRVERFACGSGQYEAGYYTPRLSVVTGSGTTDYSFAGATFPANDWVYLSFTWDATTNELKAYRNGIPTDTFPGVALPGLASDTDRMTIGIDTVNAPLLDPRTFHGLIDEIRVWKKVRTDEEILAYHDTRLDSDTTDLSALFHFDNSTLRYQGLNVVSLNKDGSSSGAMILSGTRETGLYAEITLGDYYNTGKEVRISSQTPFTETPLSGGTITCEQSEVVSGGSTVCNVTIKNQYGYYRKPPDTPNYIRVDLIGPGKITPLVLEPEGQWYTFTYSADEYQTGAVNLAAWAAKDPFITGHFSILTLSEGCGFCEFREAKGVGCVAWNLAIEPPGGSGHLQDQYTVPPPCDNPEHDNPSPCCNYYFSCRLFGRKFIRMNIKREEGMCPVGSLTPP